MQISEMVKLAHQNAVNKGWHDEKRTFGELIALCHSELSEALEEFRNGHKPTETYYPHKRCNMPDRNCFRDINDKCMSCNHVRVGKPEGIPSELADVLIRIGDLCGLYGIDLEKAVVEKMMYNLERAHRHGGKVI